MSRKLIRTSLLFTALSITASALNFLYYPITSRSLTLSEFGDVQIGISFIMQAAALFTSLNTLALFFAAQKKEQSGTIAKLERVTIAISIFLSIAVVLLAQPISSFLQLGDPSLLYLLAPIFILNIPASTWLGSIQGEGRFVASGVIAVVSSLVKIVAGLAAIGAGLGAVGALIGIMAGSLIILPLCYVIQRNESLHIRQTFRLASLSDFRLFTSRPALAVLFISLLALALSSAVDVVVAKAILHPDMAGTYAQLSTAGKIPYFATIPVAIILFERLIKGLSRRKHTLRIFVILVTVVMIATMLFETAVLQVFFGAEKGSYDSIAFLALCVAFASYSISTLLVYSLISKRLVGRVAFASFTILVVPICMVSFADLSMQSIAILYMVSQLIGTLVAVVLQYTDRHE